MLEIGAGTGETVKYYDKSKVDVVYGVEPNLEALPGLRKQLVKNGIVEKYEILGFGVEESEKMKEAGVFPGSIDTIVCVPPLPRFYFRSLFRPLSSVPRSFPFLFFSNTPAFLFPSILRPLSIIESFASELSQLSHAESFEFR